MPYSLFDIPVYAGNTAGLISEFSKSGVVLSYNPEIALALPQHSQLSEFFKKNPWNLIDGVGIAWALKKKYKQKFERTSGIDLVEALFDRGGNFFVIGSKPEVLERAIQSIKIKYVRAEVVGSHSGYFGKDEESALVQKVQAANPQYLLIGMGFPRQEQFLFNHPELFQNRVAIVMGGSLDVISGMKKRAPRLFQILGLEWLYRLVQEPQRVWRQKALLFFIFKVFMSGNR